jgi:hypothetical protein
MAQLLLQAGCVRPDKQPSLYRILTALPRPFQR